MTCCFVLLDLSLEIILIWTIQKSKSNLILAKRKKFTGCLILRRPTFPVIPGFSKEDRRSQPSMSIFSNSTNHLHAKAFLSPVTTTVMRLNCQGHLSRFSRNKRALLLTPAGGSSHWICSDTSGNGPLPFSWGEGQEWSAGSSNSSRVWDLIHLSRQAKEASIYLITQDENRTSQE